MRSADPLAKQLSHLDVSVAVHRVMQHDKADPDTAFLSLLPERDLFGNLDICLFDPPRVETIPQAKEAVKQWTEKNVKASFSPEGLPGLPQYLQDDASALLSEMARVGAVAGSARQTSLCLSHDEHGVVAKLEVLERLQDMHLAQAEYVRENSSAWLLSQDALSHVSLCLGVQKPLPMFATPSGQPSVEWSRMDHLCYLHDKGWACHFIATADERGAVVPLDLNNRVSDDKNVYVFKGVLPKHYLCCLAFVDAGLQLHHSPDTIQHCQPVGYYARFLGLESKRRREAPALQDAEAVPRNLFQVPEVDYVADLFDPVPGVEGHLADVEADADEEVDPDGQVEELLELLEEDDDDSEDGRDSVGLDNEAADPASGLRIRLVCAYVTSSLLAMPLHCSHASARSSQPMTQMKIWPMRVNPPPLPVVPAALQAARVVVLMVIQADRLSLLPLFGGDLGRMRLLQMKMRLQSQDVVGRRPLSGRASVLHTGLQPPTKRLLTWCFAATIPGPLLTPDVLAHVLGQQNKKRQLSFGA